METNFTSVKEFINWLLDNESKVLKDGYGRQWKYEKFSFYFKDIGLEDEFIEDCIDCLHLHKTAQNPDKIK